MAHLKDDRSDKLVLQGVHFELTAEMQNVMREKCAVLFRHNERIVRIHIRLQRDQALGQQNHYTATGQIEMRGPDVIATVKGDIPSSVIDELVQKLDEQLADRHGRRKDKRNHPQEIEIEAELPKVPSR